MPIVNGAHCDNVNQQFSIIGVQGTLGTADVQGTANTLPIGVDPSNGGLYTSTKIVDNTGTALGVKFVDGKPVFNEQGKITKGQNYSKPNLKPFLGVDPVQR